MQLAAIYIRVYEHVMNTLQVIGYSWYCCCKLYSLTLYENIVNARFLRK